MYVYFFASVLLDMKLSLRDCLREEKSSEAFVLFVHYLDCLHFNISFFIYFYFPGFLLIGIEFVLLSQEGNMISTSFLLSCLVLYILTFPLDLFFLHSVPSRLDRN